MRLSYFFIFLYFCVLCFHSSLISTSFASSLFFSVFYFPSDPLSFSTRVNSLEQSSPRYKLTTVMQTPRLPVDSEHHYATQYTTCLQTSLF
jgi:hypothetical protein